MGRRKGPVQPALGFWRELQQADNFPVGQLHPVGVLGHFVHQGLQVLLGAVPQWAAVDAVLHRVHLEVRPHSILDGGKVVEGSRVAVGDRFPFVFPFCPFFIELGKGDGPGIQIVWVLVIEVQSFQSLPPGGKIPKIFPDLLSFVRPSGSDPDGKGTPALSRQFPDGSITAW